MTLKIALLAVGLPLIAVGGEGLVHAARNRHQTTVTCEEVSRQAPSALWLRVTGCDVDYLSPSIRDPGGHITEMYFPVRPTGRPLSTPPSLIIVTRDPEALAVAQATIGDNRQPDQESLTVMGLRIVTVLRASREVEGFARSGILARLRTLSARSNGSIPASASLIVLDLHARPPVVVSAGVTGAGLLALTAFIWLVIRGRTRVPADRGAPSAEATAGVPADEAPVTPAIEAAPSDDVSSEGAAALEELTPFASVEAVKEEPTALPDPLASFEPKPPLEPILPAMLLLNVDGDAGPAAIERAPALGSWDDVARAITNVHAGIGFDEQGRGSVDGNDFAMILDVGPRGQVPVWTVTVRARGPAAMAAVQTLASRTGWRAFVPKTGAFVPAIDGEAVMKP